MNRDLVSVIVPVYNVEAYLEKCIDSILAQTYHRLEIILVDDGSPDNCGGICDKYAEADPRIVVIHKENGGLSDARNAGLNICRGKFVTFVDSDDSVSPEYVEYLYSLIQKYNADLSICEFRYVTEAGKEMNSPSNDSSVILMDTKEALRNLCYGKMFFDSAWAKMYRACDFKDIRYPKGKLYEDIPTTYRVMLRAKKLVFGRKALYHYLYRKEAISKQAFSAHRLDAMYFVEKQSEEITKAYPELESVCSSRLFTECVYISKNIAISKGDYRKTKHDIYQKIKNCRKNVEVSKLSLKFKVYYYVHSLGIHIFYFFARLETKFSRRVRNVNLIK